MYNALLIYVYMYTPIRICIYVYIYIRMFKVYAYVYINTARFTLYRVMQPPSPTRSEIARKGAQRACAPRFYRSASRLFNAGEVTSRDPGLVLVPFALSSSIPRSLACSLAALAFLFFSFFLAPRASSSALSDVRSDVPSQKTTSPSPLLSRRSAYHIKK